MPCTASHEDGCDDTEIGGVVVPIPEPVCMEVFIRMITPILGIKTDNDMHVNRVPLYHYPAENLNILLLEIAAYPLDIVKTK